MLKILKTAMLTLLVLIALLIVLVFDTSPNIEVSSTEQVNNADSVQPLINELRRSVRSRYVAQQLNVSSKQANSLAGFLHRALDKANAQVSFTSDMVIIAGTYAISTGAVPIYFNIEAQIKAGKGLQLDTVTLGDLPLPGEFALGSAESLVNTYTSSKVATKAIGTVESIVIVDDGMQVNLAPTDTLLREFQNIETGGSDKDTRALKIRIAHYLRLLDNLHVPSGPKNANIPSLAIYLNAVMKEAAVLSQQGSATLENEAAILAVTIYAGSPRFTALIGDLSFAIDKIPSASPRPVLHNRQDLSLHFIFSAAIKLLSQKGISIAVGEFKELMDRGKGGSGYSFIDLAADLSGAHFADLAVNPQSAQRIQAVMQSAANEALFMVDIAGLKEGLSKNQFAAQYGEVDSEAYQQVVSEINTRIDRLAISR